MYSAIIALCLICSINAVNVDKTDIQFLSDCLAQHNYYRTLHDSPVVGFEVDLIHVAESKAQAFAAGNQSDFDDHKYGTNSAWNAGSGSVNCRAVVDGWYREMKYYNHKKAHYKNNAPHFTQLIWKSTTSIGCAQVANDSPISAVYTVCVYSPKVIAANYLTDSQSVYYSKTLFYSECVEQHNYYRRAHDSPAVGYVHNLNEMAENIAKVMAHSEITDFDDTLVDDYEYGINTLWSPNVKRVNCRTVVDHWYSEVKYFKKGTKNDAPHFTQIVWKATENFGCAQKYSSKPIVGVYTVCVYYPKGNVKSTLNDNVVV